MAEVIDLTASQPDGLSEPGTSVRRQGAGQEVDLVTSPQHRRRQRPADDCLIDLTGGDDDEENWQPRPAKRHRAERQQRQQQEQQQQQQQRDPCGNGGWEVDGLEWAAAATAAGPIAQPLQQRPQLGAQHSPQLLEDSPEPQQEPQQPERPPAQQEEQQRRQDVQQEAAAQEEPQAQQRCDICFDDEIAPAFMHTFAACKHSFCLPCLREYISGKISDRTFPVPCPLPDCKAPISAAECGLVLTAEEAATLGKMEAEAAIGEGARLFCPNPQCSMLLLNDDKQADAPIECPYCQKQLCANCGVAWHAGMTCQQYQAQPGALRSKEDQALLDLAEQEGMRRCPACGAMVQRTQGCSYMSCRCGAHFCYGCGKRKEKGSSHYCGCKPAHEQWLNAPPGIAEQLQQNAAAYVQQFQQRQAQVQQRQAQVQQRQAQVQQRQAQVQQRQAQIQQRQAEARQRAQVAAAAQAERAREQAAAHAALMHEFVQRRQQQRRERRAAQQAQQQQQHAVAAGAAAGAAAAMQVPPLFAGLPGGAGLFPVGALPPFAAAAPLGLLPPPAGVAAPGLLPDFGQMMQNLNQMQQNLNQMQKRMNRR